MVSTSIRVYKIKEFIRVDKQGVLDAERSKELIRRLSATASFSPVENILIDLRQTVVAGTDMAGLLDVAAEVARYESSFRGRVAVIIPPDEARVALAQTFKALVNIEIGPSRYEVFTRFEDAVDWLSEIEKV